MSWFECCKSSHARPLLSTAHLDGERQKKEQQSGVPLLKIVHHSRVTPFSFITFSLSIPLRFVNGHFFPLIIRFIQPLSRKRKKQACVYHNFTSLFLLLRFSLLPCSFKSSFRPWGRCPHNVSQFFFLF